MDAARFTANKYYAEVIKGKAVQWHRNNKEVQLNGFSTG
jgi:hypothetical protein